MTNDFDYFGKYKQLTGKDVTLTLLKTWADELAIRFWGVKYSGTMELTSRMWYSRWACYVCNMRTGKQHIRFSRPRNAQRTIEAIRKSLAHELVHWRLQTTGIPHRDVNNEFIAECLRVGASISMTTSAQLAFRQYDLDKRLGYI